MEFIIHGLHRELTADLKFFIESRIRDKVLRYTNKIGAIEVFVDKESEHHEHGLERVRVVAWVPAGTKTRDGKKRLTVEAQSTNLRDAINMATKEIMRRVHDWLDEQKPHYKSRA